MERNLNLKINGTLKLCPLAIAIATAYFPVAQAADASFVEFNTNFMSPDSKNRIDIARYEKGVPVPGKYNVEVLINGVAMGRYDLQVSDGSGALPDGAICLTKKTFINLEINIEKLSKASLELLNGADDDQCLPVDQILPEASFDLDTGEQMLSLAVADIYLIKRPRGYVNPALWDQGITAGILNYNANFYRSVTRNNESDALYAGINSGFNIMGWYFRHNGSLSWQEDAGRRYQSLDTYVQRDIVPLSSRLTLGDAHTTGEQFDTLAFRGIQLANAEQMLPDSQRGYAPLITGIARTNARVKVMQQNRLLYETTVAPGAFEINDLYPTGYGGELEVIIEEADGSVQRQSIPFASTSNLLRPGITHYSATVGHLRKGWVEDEPLLAEFTWRRGLSNRFTAYTGIQGNEDYKVAQLGLAVGTPVGAFSFDVTHARSTLPKQYESFGRSMSGESYQLKYSHMIQQTGSNISVAAYRFSTEGYMDFMTAMQLREAMDNNDRQIELYRPKSRLGLTANQRLPEGWGNFYASLYQQDYWNQRGSDRQYQFGYNNHIGRINYSLSASRNRNGEGEYETRYMLSMSIPFSSDSLFSQMSVNLNRDNDGRLREQVGLSGTALENSALSYSVSAANANKGGSSSGAFNSSLRTPWTTVQASAGAGKHYHNYSLGMNGTAVLHSGGVTLSPYSGDTMALVEAKGAKGAAVSNYPGVRIDRFGYAVVPYLNAWQMNEISIDPKGLPDDVELNLTSQKVAPYSGAVVKLSYGTTMGTPVLIVLDNDSHVPFGADVFDGEQNAVGVVGQGRRIFARLAQQSGQLKVRWGEAPNQQCLLNYQLPNRAKANNSGMLTLNGRCVAR
ncbi:fimbrial biogenesis outer membrane usher protein [Jejubacter calystegiae]|uniref:Fimbrial biogenesis outer membrane usher protein n=1 Tax=Jejubacter calystegiae TaxID=2579935 RepID=A0A4P8YRX7_9ENTR|nr:fimbria/pilus outer membrane usher protein [Jejubacter calystegiae]QCT21502.1 fimbrial biogenesis outer membrane usher protein [Jejubacter calystegiae]